MEQGIFRSKDGLKNLMAQPHGRRMVAAFLSHQATPAPDAFVSALAGLNDHERADMKLLLRGRKWVKGEAGCAFKNGFIDKIEPGDEAFNLFSEIARRENVSEVLGFIHPVCLASPMLSPAAAEEIYHLPGATKQSREILLASPNMPHKYRRETFGTSPSLAFLMAASTYGDLEDGEIRRIIRGHILDTANFKKNHFGCCEKLASRRDISLDMLSHMDKKFDGFYYWLLTKNPLHKRIRDAGGVKPLRLKNCMGEKGIRLGPEADAKELKLLFDEVQKSGQAGKLPSWPEDMAIIAAQPNADRQVVEAALDALEPLMTGRLMQLFEGGAYAEAARVAVAKKEAAGFAAVHAARNCSPETLLWACEELVKHAEGSIVSLATHLNFPWGKVANQYVAERTVPNEAPVIIAAKCLAGKASQQEIKEWVSGADWQSALFAENLSGVQLAKIASLHPEAAALAALHPNGETVRVPTASENVVKAFRENLPSPILVGRRGNNSPASGLVGIEL